MFSYVGTLPDKKTIPIPIVSKHPFNNGNGGSEYIGLVRINNLTINSGIISQNNKTKIFSLFFLLFQIIGFYNHCSNDVLTVK